MIALKLARAFKLSVEDLFSLREWRSLFGFVFRRGGLQSLLPMYFSYYRPSFEPWELDNSEMLRDWQAELTSSPVYLAATP